MDNNCHWQPNLFGYLSLGVCDGQCEDDDGDGDDDHKAELQFADMFEVVLLVLVAEVAVEVVVVEQVLPVEDAVDRRQQLHANYSNQMQM